MYLIFDTETSGFPSASIPATHPDQARIVQLAWLLLDEEFKERASFCSLIRISPSVKIHEGAHKAHGISEKDCYEYGIEQEAAISPFFQLAERCKVIAHNLKFDYQMMQIEYEILMRSSYYHFPSEFCTMQAMTPICKLPFANSKRGYGGQQYKWPTLQEAHQHCFGEEFEGAHDALADVRACARVFKWLKEKQIATVAKLQEAFPNMNVNDEVPVVNKPYGLSKEQYDTKVA